MNTNEVVGRNFLCLDIGLPVEALKKPIRNVITGEKSAAEIALTAINRRGRTIRCEVTMTPLKKPNKEIRGVILMIDQVGNGTE
jgi:two-component system, chemotaxis family, CheB/CheR fusion protein